MSLYNVDYLALGDCIQNPSMSVIEIYHHLRSVARAVVLYQHVATFVRAKPESQTPLPPDVRGWQVGR
jgi:hypothetical protein